MFTTAKLHDKVFKSGLGYDKKDVEQFINELSSDFELLLRENDDLKKNVKDLNDSIRYYKSIEKTLQKALVLAEKTAQDVKAAALKEAETIELDARTKAKQIQTEARKRLEILEHKTLNLIQQYDFFKIQFENLLNAQMKLIGSESFTINTADFIYRAEDLTDPPEEEQTPEPMQLSASMEDMGRLQDDLEVLSSEQSYQTEDGFEFITL